jgi:hypothetical protein
MLAEHPHVLKELREEILLKVGSSRRPTYDDLRDMKFLRAVINGSLLIPSFCLDADLDRNTEVIPACVSYSMLLLSILVYKHYLSVHSMFGTTTVLVLVFKCLYFRTSSTNKPALWPAKDPGGKPFYIPANTK